MSDDEVIEPYNHSRLEPIVRATPTARHFSDDDEVPESPTIVPATPPSEIEQEPIKKNKRPATQALEENESNKSQKAELQPGDHIYFEPRWLNDIEIVYGGIIFHCHKVLLVKESKYFSVALSGDTKCDHLDIMELQSPFKEVVTPAAFQHFLQTMHDIYPVNSLMVKDFLSTYGYLLHYFECNDLRESWEATNQPPPQNVQFIWLATAVEYHWPEKKRIFDDTVGRMSYLLSNHAKDLTIQKGWKMLLSEIKIRLLLTVIDKKTQLTIPANLLPAL